MTYGYGQTKSHKKKKIRRNVRRTVYSLLVIPARLPRLTVQSLNFIMRICEIAGFVFVITLLACMVNEASPAKSVSIISGIIFVLSLITIQLQMYRNSLESHGYDITGRAF